jgi:alpha-ketoglutarate-dependent taurine dioxygenase
MIVRRQRQPILATSAFEIHALSSMRTDEPPCLLRPHMPGLSLEEVYGQRLEHLRRLYAVHGAVLLRGFHVDGAAGFDAFVRRFARRPAQYREPATPRSHVLGNVFTSTEYPSDQTIPLHNENSHCLAWPMTIMFFCEMPAETLGATPIADCGGVLRRLEGATRVGFERRKIRYTRWFGGGLGFSWQKVFGVSTRAEVDAYCDENRMQAIWSGERLTVTYVRDAIHRHPVSAEQLWFNHGLFFNPVSLPEALRLELAELQAQGAVDELPYDTSYGDGSPFEAMTLQEIRAAYAAETRTFAWRAGDVLVLDNMRFAHGRQPYTGRRRVLVGMSDESDAWVN